METHLIIAARVDLLDDNERDLLLARCEEIGKMLGAFIRKAAART
jgi:four helix bundle protein